MIYEHVQTQPHSHLCVSANSQFKEPEIPVASTSDLFLTESSYTVGLH